MDLGNDGRLPQHDEDILQVPGQNLTRTVVTLTRGKFGEQFYRLVVIDLKPHSKGLIVELGLILDPNTDNLKDIETSLEDQVKDRSDRQ